MRRFCRGFCVLFTRASPCGLSALWVISGKGAEAREGVVPSHEESRALFFTVSACFGRGEAAVRPCLSPVRIARPVAPGVDQDRLREFMTSKQDDPKRGSIMLTFERLSPKLSFHDVALVRDASGRTVKEAGVGGGGGYRWHSSAP